MDIKKYKNLKRYAAFLFMLFAVCSGSQDDLNIQGTAKSLRGAAVYALRLQGILVQGIQSIKAEESSERSRFDFSGLNDIAGESRLNITVGFYQTAIFSISLFILALNDWMVRNGIWRRMVF